MKIIYPERLIEDTVIFQEMAMRGFLYGGVGLGFLVSGLGIAKGTVIAIRTDEWLRINEKIYWEKMVVEPLTKDKGDG